jgi:hypothetical protein
LASEEARARYVHVMALVVLVGAAREARSGGGGWYAAALASDAPPAFVRRLLAPAPGEAQPSLWALGGDFAAAVAAADELQLPADVTLELAALRDQALYGDVNIAKPGLMASFATSVSGAEWCVCVFALLRSEPASAC